MGGKSRKTGAMSKKLIEILKKSPLHVSILLPEEKKKMVDEILWKKENQLLGSIAADAKAFLTIQKKEE